MAARVRTRPFGSALVVVVTVCLLAGLVAVAVSVRRASPVAAASGPGPYDVAQVVDTNPDPNIVETSITAEPAVIDVGHGLLANMWTFNGTVPGPQFRLTVGQTVIVHFTNLLPEPTGIHWHGIELANASDGTPLTQNQVPTGGTFIYKFTVTRPGIFWYHPHHHASTNHVSRGLYGSMIVTDANHESTLIAKGVLPGAAQTKTLVLSDTTVCANPDPSPLCSAPIDHAGNPIGAPLAAGDIPNIQIAIPNDVNEGRTVLTNGVNVGGRAGTPTSPGALDPNALKLDVQAGQGLRLQLVDAATVRYFRLVLTDNSGTPITLFRIGGQGGLLDNAIVEGGVISGYDTRYSPGEILLAPGQRADVVAAIPSTATGVLTLWTEGFVRTDDGSPVPPTEPVAHFNINGTATTPYTITNGTPLLTDPSVNAPVEVLPAPTATLLDPSTFSPPKIGLASQTIGLTNTANDGLGVDGVQGTHDALGSYTNIPHMGSTRYATIGDVLQLTVINETTVPVIDHPFHLHGFSIQPISLTPWPGATAPVPTASYTWPYHEFVDEIDIPYKYMLTFRVRIDDRPLMDGVTPGGALGRWMFHCHLFAHATFGMMSELDIVAANGNERPYVNADHTPIAGNQGSTFTNTGTWMDPDGDPVTLTASVGTIVKDPSGVTGAWTWSYTPGPGAPELVYITATDAGGKKDQAVFALDINAPPVVTISAGQTTTINQGATLNVAANFTDTGADQPYTATIDYGTGAGPQPVTPNMTTNTAPIAGTVAGSFQYQSNGSFPVTVTVTDQHGATGSATFTVTVNAAPVVTISAGQTTSIAEGATLNVVANFTDATPTPPYTATIDYGTGTGPQPVSATVTSGPAPIVGTVAGNFQYGDNGTFTVTVSVTDAHGTITSEHFNVTVANVNPTATISGGASVRGTPTFFADVGQTLTLNATITDPGSDDLTTTWNFGDGRSAPTQTSLVNAPAFEPPTPSPSVQPRDITDPAAHTYRAACLYTLNLVSTDDDGGSSSTSGSVIITRRPQPAHSASYWQHQYAGQGRIDFTAPVRRCYLQTVGALSSVFDDVNNASTIPLASRILSPPANTTDIRRLLNREILTAWLNLANGGIRYNEKLDTDGNHTLDRPFSRVMTTAEAVRLNPTSTRAQIQTQRAILQRVN